MDISMAKNYDHLFKVLLIGDPAVGKTCILCRFANDEFKTTHLSTIGIDFKMRTFNVEGSRIRIQMWDTAGQERYETITTQYYRRAQGIMLVYDITRRKTFDNIQKWIHYVEEHAGSEVKTLIIGNKCDVGENKRQVSYGEGEKLSQKYGIPFFETSAYSNVNIEKAFAEMCQLILGHVDIPVKNGRKRSEAIILAPKPPDSEERSSSSCCSLS
ncbi:ras-related protein Rab-8A-like [Dendronephthya gigantea]|uniref:ras-related protein Rab-8A-like n=1 Tax=Dendronephthya gigantea TaxID=151771 RepID=UPI00106936FE|nr:ras-related protein Rab-8A-like [Dendronephthya gigantea]